MTPTRSSRETPLELGNPEVAYSLRAPPRPPRLRGCFSFQAPLNAGESPGPGVPAAIRGRQPSNHDGACARSADGREERTTPVHVP